MNGVDFLADTNFIIHLNQGNVIIETFLEYHYAISFITEIELLGAFSISRAQKQQFQDLINDCAIIEMDYRLKNKCIDFRN
jgi:predicted nucleic acid-binding protein